MREPDDGGRELVARIRAGDPAAVEEFFKRYEREMLTIARRMLHRSALRTLIDSHDLMQSVVRDFTFALQAGKYPALNGQGISPLLAKFIRVRCLHHRERQTADRRDVRRRDVTPVESLELVSKELDPAEVVERDDLVKAVQDELSPEEREILTQRAAGHSWKSVVGGDGSAVQRVRMRLQRALARIRQRLGLSDGES